MKYTLVKIAPNGIRSYIADDFDEGILITMAQMLIKKHPADQYGVVDNLGFFIWPVHLSRAHIPPAYYDPIIISR